MRMISCSRCPFTFIVALVMIMTQMKDNTIGAETVVPSQRECYCLHKVMSDLHNPVAATFVVRSLKQQIIVAEQRGVVKILTKGVTKVMLDMRDIVVSSNDYGDERGLLSVVPSPDFSTNGKIYAAYTRQVSGDEYTYVSEFHTDGDEVDKSSERFLLRVYQPFKTGNGGPMFFGDDGYLYIVTGDGGAEDDKLGHAQNRNSLQGSILRIDVGEGQSFMPGETGMARAYLVPSDNPFVNISSGKAKGEIYAYGFRNPWGCSQDSTSLGGDARIYCAETGTSRFDEINLIEKGKNYGWNLKEGSQCFNQTLSQCPPIENERLPTYEFPHAATGQQALVGGFVYRGRDFDWLRSNHQTNYVYGDVISGQVHILEGSPAKENWTSVSWNACASSNCPENAKEAPLKHLLAFSRDLDGELYLLMVDALTAQSPEGKMFQMVSPSSAPGDFTAFNSFNVALTAFVSLSTHYIIYW